MSFSDSEQRHFKAVLSESVLGDDKPSHLLSKMKQLSGETPGEDFLKTLWLQYSSHPTRVQAILSVSEDSLEKLAMMANKIHETANEMMRYIALNLHFRLFNELRAEIADPTKLIKHLSRSRQRQNNSGNISFSK